MAKNPNQKKLFKIFPDFAQKQICEINLDTFARRWLTQQNPKLAQAELLNPLISWEMIKEAHKSMDAEWSFGGYLEDRSILLAGGYQKETSSFIHLGIDINLPVGVKVFSPFNGKALLIDDEKDYNGGWGPRLIIQPEKNNEFAMIFSHLQNISVGLCENIREGQIIGEIGAAPWNGNWWPHLHIQAVQLIYLNKLIQEERLLVDLDGYCSLDLLENLQIIHPDPLSIIM